MHSVSFHVHKPAIVLFAKHLFFSTLERRTHKSLKQVFFFGDLHDILRFSRLESLWFHLNLTLFQNKYKKDDLKGYFWQGALDSYVCCLRSQALIVPLFGEMKRFRKSSLHIWREVPFKPAYWHRKEEEHSRWRLRREWHNMSVKLA